MAAEVNRKVVLAVRPKGMPEPSCFRVEEEEIEELVALNTTPINGGLSGSESREIKPCPPEIDPESFKAPFS